MHTKVSWVSSETHKLFLSGRGQCVALVPVLVWGSGEGEGQEERDGNLESFVAMS